MKTFIEKSSVEVGCDEAGRGPLAGPVFAASVILPKGFRHYLIRDSKKLTPKQRRIARRIIEKKAINWSVSMVGVKTIEKINIQNSIMVAIHRCLKKLKVNFDLILMDGNTFKKYKKKRHKCIVKGDNKIYSIAAASILAKTHRDEYMFKLSKKFPIYNWQQNKGYGTQEHIELIKEKGACKHHRPKFVKKFLNNEESK